VRLSRLTSSRAKLFLYRRWLRYTAALQQQQQQQLKHGAAWLQQRDVSWP